MHLSKEKKPQPSKTLRSSRDYRHLDAHAFATDLTEHLLETMPVDASADDLVAHYETSTTQIIDRHWYIALLLPDFMLRDRVCLGTAVLFMRPGAYVDA